MSDEERTPRPKYGTPEHRALNESHCSDPQPGDYWHEMFCPYLVVLGRVRKQILVCQTRTDVGRDRWTWNLDKLDLITTEQLRKKVTYQSIDSFVADVEPRCHMWAVKEVGGKA